MSKIFVDIVIPSYRPTFFRQALGSAIGQTYPYTRIFVSDNCPTDEILSIVRSFGDNRVSYKRNSRLGVWNYLSAFQMGDSPLIKPLFDDDVLHPFLIERFVSQLIKESGDGLTMLFSSSSVIDTANRRYRERRPFRGPATLTKADFYNLSLGNIVNFVGEFSSVMFPRLLLQEMLKKSDNPFDWRGVNGVEGLPDVCFFLNALEFSKLAYIDEELSYFRQSDDHVSDSNFRLNPNAHLLYTKWMDLFMRLRLPAELSHLNLERIQQFISTTRARFPDNADVTRKSEAFEQYILAAKAFYDV